MQIAMVFSRKIMVDNPVSQITSVQRYSVLGLYVSKQLKWMCQSEPIVVSDVSRRDMDRVKTVRSHGPTKEIKMLSTSATAVGWHTQMLSTPIGAL
jgi:hypothetical protein